MLSPRVSGGPRCCYMDGHVILTHKGFLIQWLHLQKASGQGIKRLQGDPPLLRAKVLVGALSPYERPSEIMVGDEMWVMAACCDCVPSGCLRSACVVCSSLDRAWLSLSNGSGRAARPVDTGILEHNAVLLVNKLESWFDLVSVHVVAICDLLSNNGLRSEDLSVNSSQSIVWWNGCVHSPDSFFRHPQPNLMDPHQHQPIGQADETSPPPSNTAATSCRCCGGPTTCPPPPACPTSLRHPPTRPIRAPAINLPPSNSQQAIILAPVPQARRPPLSLRPIFSKSPSSESRPQTTFAISMTPIPGKNFLGFVVSLSESIRSHKISDPCHQSPILNSILSILQSLIDWVDEIPPVQHLPVTIRVAQGEDYQALVSRVFVKYLELMRKLQFVYCLEPAGSHGVWGLDDYHFLPFIFGSSQLIDHKYMKPKSIHNQDILDNFSKEYMYISCIAL
ncbi:putative serine/threonine-protein phosphatase 2A activator 2 [Vitis vinifera]|uniref:Serine/threonine-protein phosphatase 2A activator n=1 Tax=Vitis vinifera TaxID=29760 RepID=A0A438FZJ7_VITVI|nr:putative serine/threonine-protein phosphatase 2A activator 2 [Vitis vinifera]